MTRAYFTAATYGISLYISLSVNTLSKFFLNSKKDIHNKCNNSFNQLTLWNKPLSYTSMFTKSKLNNIERNLIQLTPRVKSILIGLLLSDGWIQKRGHWNPRIGLKQSIINFPLIWHSYNELAYILSGKIMLGKSLLRNKIFYSLSIQTRQLPCLIELFNLFYVKTDGKYVKSIKPELYNYMDYIILAYWIMGDGSKKNKGITLCTDSFKLQEVVLLINIFILKFDIKPTLHKEKNNYRIYINKKNINKLKPYLLPYFLDHFIYKLKD